VLRAVAGDNSASIVSALDLPKGASDYAGGTLRRVHFRDMAAIE